MSLKQAYFKIKGDIMNGASLENGGRISANNFDDLRNSLFELKPFKNDQLRQENAIEITILKYINRLIEAEQYKFPLSLTLQSKVRTSTGSRPETEALLFQLTIDDEERNTSFIIDGYYIQCYPPPGWTLAGSSMDTIYFDEILSIINSWQQRSKSSGDLLVCVDNRFHDLENLRLRIVELMNERGFKAPSQQVSIVMDGETVIYNVFGA